MGPEPGKEVAAFVPVQRRIIVFENGVPVLTSRPVLTKTHIQSLYLVVAAQPYEGPTDPLDPEFGRYDGMTVAEVMVRKQLEAAAKTGDVQAIEIAMDRLIGKPLTKSENHTITDTYESFLKRLSESIVPAPVDVTPESPFGDMA